MSFGTLQFHLVIRTRRPFAQIRSEMAHRAIDFIHRQNQTRQRDCSFVSCLSDRRSISSRIASSLSVLCRCQGFFKPLRSSAVRVAAVMFSKPAVLGPVMHSGGLSTLCSGRAERDSTDNNHQTLWTRRQYRWQSRDSRIAQMPAIRVSCLRNRQKQFAVLLSERAEGCEARA